jgi:hypothetical protein
VVTAGARDKKRDMYMRARHRRCVEASRTYVCPVGENMGARLGRVFGLLPGGTGVDGVAGLEVASRCRLSLCRSRFYRDRRHMGPAIVSPDDRRGGGGVE